MISGSDTAEAEYKPLPSNPQDNTGDVEVSTLCPPVTVSLAFMKLIYVV